MELEAQQQKNNISKKVFMSHSELDPWTTDLTVLTAWSFWPDTLSTYWNLKLDLYNKNNLHK